VTEQQGWQQFATFWRLIPNNYSSPQ